MSIALYIGAGTDIEPITKCPEIKTFYYVDCQPNSEFGVRYDLGFVRPNFIPDLNKEMTKIGMEFIDTVDNIRTYSNGDQTVHYYTNTAIPEHNDRIKSLEYDTLIVAGHHPHYCFLDNNSHQLKFIGFQGTSYSKEEQETLLSRSYTTNKILIQDSDQLLINHIFTPYLSLNPHLSKYTDKTFYKVSDNNNIAESTRLNNKKLNDDELREALNNNTAIFEVTTKNKKQVYFLNRYLLDADEIENINWKLHYDEDTRNRFHSFEYIHRDKSDRQPFTKWNNFVKYSEFVLKIKRFKRDIN